LPDGPIAAMIGRRRPIKRVLAGGDVSAAFSSFGPKELCVLIHP
jgi:hypothetical protein